MLHLHTWGRFYSKCLGRHSGRRFRHRGCRLRRTGCIFVEKVIVNIPVDLPLSTAKQTVPKNSAEEHNIIKGCPLTSALPLSEGCWAGHAVQACLCSICLFFCLLCDCSLPSFNSSPLYPSLSLPSSLRFFGEINCPLLGAKPSLPHVLHWL